MVSQGVQRKPSKEVYTSGSRIKDHKHIKKDPSDLNIRARGRNTLKQCVRLKKLIFMPIMPKPSLVHFAASPTCMPKPRRGCSGFYMCIGWYIILCAPILPPEKFPLSLWA